MDTTTKAGARIVATTGNQLPPYAMKPEQLSRLLAYQELAKDEPPVTQRATFKLKDLKTLIEYIEKHVTVKGKYGEDYYHRLCITFVRDNTDKNKTVLDYTAGQNMSTISKNGHQLTQLVPIITGCLAELDPTTKLHTKFEYLKVDGVIPYVRSGGEASGLIPPPPPKDDTLVP